jgi:hypothetical protein
VSGSWCHLLEVVVVSKRTNAAGCRSATYERGDGAGHDELARIAHGGRQAGVGKTQWPRCGRRGGWEDDDHGYGDCSRVSQADYLAVNACCDRRNAEQQGWQ